MFAPRHVPPTWLEQQGHGDLEKEWNARLAASDPDLRAPEIRSLYASSARDGLRVVPLELCDRSGRVVDPDGDWTIGAGGVRLGNHPVARKWAVFSQQVAALSTDYPARDRAFLEAMAEAGSVCRAARVVGISTRAGYRMLARFRKWQQGCRC